MEASRSPAMATFENSYRTRGTLHQQFDMYKEQVRRIGVETRRQQQGQHKDDAPTCGICRKTKFADGCGNLCSYCQTKFCARCGGRVSLRSNNVRNPPAHVPPPLPPFAAVDPHPPFRLFVRHNGCLHVVFANGVRPGLAVTLRPGQSSSDFGRSFGLICMLCYNYYECSDD
ncbi:hypothetical protein DPEC_G00173680 [Dallia pectoralis]|uniref:Uncharacterized protein n=1 Tax=Dallia pectoralis TaxID=75939 RepID=A0ACC2GDW8_DALPE|nr:hypothetical protein DPEC_G00173680 [Dallia pectoralis]